MIELCRTKLASHAIKIKGSVNMHGSSSDLTGISGRLGCIVGHMESRKGEGKTGVVSLG